MSNQNNQKSLGLLTVQVYTADQALPIDGANVIISKNSENGEELIRILKTDQNGRTHAIELPAPPMANSLSPGNANMFNIYNIRVDYPGYYTVENRNVPIFENRTSIQPVSLMPLPEGSEKGKKLIFNENEMFNNDGKAQ